MPKTTLIETDDGEVQCYLNVKNRICLAINCISYQPGNSAYITMDIEDAVDLVEELKTAILDLKEEEEQLQLQQKREEATMAQTEEAEEEEEVYEDDNLDEICQVYLGKKEDE